MDVMRARLDIPTAVPGVSCTQYSESGLVINLFHVRMASYLVIVSITIHLTEERKRQPFLDLVWVQRIHDTPIVIIPPHLSKVARNRVVVQYRVP